MEIGAIFIGLTILAASLPFVIKPLKKGHNRKFTHPVERINPDEQRVAILSALGDLDFDFQTGKVSEEDYASMRAQLLAEATQYIHLEQSDDEIEALIHARKAAQAEAPACGNCGAPLEIGNRFCSNCGAAVERGCPACGRKVKTGDLFCSICGTKLEVKVEAAA